MARKTIGIFPIAMSLTARWLLNWQLYFLANDLSLFPRAAQYRPRLCLVYRQMFT
jgi:hypothetical protein